MAKSMLIIGGAYNGRIIDWEEYDTLRARVVNDSGHLVDEVYWHKDLSHYELKYGECHLLVHEDVDEKEIMPTLMRAYIFAGDSVPNKNPFIEEVRKQVAGQTRVNVHEDDDDDVPFKVYSSAPPNDEPF
jgi:hypothetical protein